MESRLVLFSRFLSGYRQTRRYMRRRRMRPAPSIAPSISKAIDDSALYGDLHTSLEDAWVSSPYPKSDKRLQDQQKDEEESKKIDPSKTSIILFPGQGSQFVGMGRQLQKFPNVPQLYDCASQILGYDLLKLCLEGPQEKLDMTVNCQPAVFVTALAAVEKLRDEYPSAIEDCVATAGFSVGEYAALTFAGSMNFESSLELVKARAIAMQEASEIEPSGLVTVMLRASSKLGLAMETSKKYMKKKGHKDPVCQIANHLFVQCKVIGGHEEALQFLMDNAGDFNVGPLKRLSVSGAFHTNLMEPAKEALNDALRNTKFVQPLIAVHSNLDGKPHSADPKIIRKKLLQQLWKPVRWEQSMHYIFDRDTVESFPRVYEMGPGAQLTTILKRINGKAAQGSSPVKV